MTVYWALREVPLRLQLGDVTLAAPVLRLAVRETAVSEMTSPREALEPPGDGIPEGCDGFLERSVPVSGPQPAYRVDGKWMTYVPSQYERYFIDLRKDFADYQAKFSSKTRSTIQKKIRRFQEHCGGELKWQRYAEANEVREYHRLARRVSELSYQERLLDAGLPASEAFIGSTEEAAARGDFRGYLLFHGSRPVAYLCCPITQGVVTYAHVGFDPEYDRWSVGTILQWMALGSLFEEQRHHLFDFTEGQSEHKRLFATGSVRCVNVYFLRCSLRNRTLVLLHRGISSSSRLIGDVLQRYGLKSKIRRWLRSGR